MYDDLDKWWNNTDIWAVLMLAYLGIKSCLNGGAKTASKLTHFALGRKSEHAVVCTALMQGLVISWLLKKCRKMRLHLNWKNLSWKPLMKIKMKIFRHQPTWHTTCNMQPWAVIGSMQSFKDINSARAVISCKRSYESVEVMQVLW